MLPRHTEPLISDFAFDFTSRDLIKELILTFGCCQYFIINLGEITSNYISIH